METCSVSLDLGASSQLAATIIGSSQRLFSLAEVYDMSDDAWLGKGNNMRLITRTFIRRPKLYLAPSLMGARLGSVLQQN